MPEQRSVSIALLWWIVLIFNSGAFILAFSNATFSFPLYAVWILGGNLVLVGAIVNRVWRYAVISNSKRAILLSALLLPLFFFGIQLIAGQFLPDPDRYLHFYIDVDLIACQKPVMAALTCGAAALFLSHLVVLVHMLMGKSA